MSVLAAATFGFFTMALQSTTELFSEPAVALCILILVWAILRWRHEWRWACSRDRRHLCRGNPVPFRFDFDGLDRTSGTPYVRGLEGDPKTSQCRCDRASRPSEPGIPCMVQRPQVQNFLAFSYGGQAFHTPIGRGLEGLVFSPGKSIFVFNPIALLGLVGIVIFLLSRPTSCGAVHVADRSRIFFFSKWDSWDGGVAWGPRFLDPVVALFAIAAVEVVVASRDKRGWDLLTRLAFVALIVLSLGVSFLSVRVPYEQWFQTISTPALRIKYDGGRLLPDPNAPPQAVSNAFDFTLQGGHLIGDIDLLEKGTAKTAPWSFQGGRQVGGWLLLLGGLVLTIAAAAAALKSDRRQTAQRAAENGPRDPAPGQWSGGARRTTRWRDGAGYDDASRWTRAPVDPRRCRCSTLMDT